MKYNREYKTVMRNGVRYANADATATDAGVSSASATGSGVNGWSFFDNLGSNLFGWLGNKQQVQLANVTSNRDIATDSNRTTRTTIIVLGLVALAIVAAIVVKSKKK